MARKVNHFPLWLILLLSATLILRLPSLFEPFSYGDETIYLTLGEGIRKGLVLYRDIHDNKPPLLYFLAAIAGNVFWFRAILIAWMLTTITLFCHFAEKLFPKNKPAVKVSTVIFAFLTTIPLLEGQTSNAELFMLLPTIGAFYLLFGRSVSKKTAFLAGLLFSIATLFKFPAIFDMGTIIFIWLIATKLTKPKEISSFIKNSAILTLGFITPIALSALWYFSRGALNEYLLAAFLQNVGYVSSWNHSGEEISFFTKNLSLFLRTGVVLTGLSTLYGFRRKLSKPFIFTSAWFLFSLFATTLSERPYPHYLIQTVPAIALLTGILAAKKNREQTLAIIPLTLAVLTPLVYHFWYYPSLPYYQRFTKLFLGQISKEEYFQEFGGDVLSNYKIAHFIVNSTTRTDKIFVWGDSAQIYALTRRLPPTKYIATYHIQDFSTPEETLEMLDTNKPEFVIIKPGSPIFDGLVPFLQEYYLQIQTIHNVAIWHHINPVVLETIR